MSEYLHFYDQNGKRLVVFEGLDSAVNYVRMINGQTDDTVGIVADGPDGDIDLTILNKGNGTINIGTASTLEVKIHCPLRVNYEVKCQGLNVETGTLIFANVGENADVPLTTNYTVSANDVLQFSNGVLVAINP